MVLINKKEMENKTSFSEITRVAHNAIDVVISHNNVGVKIRITYLDKSRKNARYNDWQVTEIYIISLLQDDKTAEDLTNTFLFIERKKQWIFETVIRRHQHKIKN